MSVPKAHRNWLAVLVGGASLTLVTLAVAATPVPVKATSRNEVAPTAAGDWFAWSKSRSREQSPFDVWAQRGTEPAFKVSAKGTQAYTGGIDGTRLVYQQIRNGRSDLRLFDLVARRHVPLPAGVNTSGWECCATISGDWLLFSRGGTYSSDLQVVLLRNLATGEQRILERLRNRKGLLSAGQVDGNYAVWTRCDPYPRCRIVRYDIAANATAPLSVPSGKVVYSPAVNPGGTAYYARSNRGCGKRVELVKDTLTGGAETLLTLPRGQDLDVAYALTLPPRPPGEVVTTRVFYDRVVCRRQSWDIYRIDDIERLPPPPP